MHTGTVKKRMREEKKLYYCLLSGVQWFPMLISAAEKRFDSDLGPNFHCDSDPDPNPN